MRSEGGVSVDLVSHPSKRGVGRLLEGSLKSLIELGFLFKSIYYKQSPPQTIIIGSNFTLQTLNMK